MAMNNKVCSGIVVDKETMFEVYKGTSSENFKFDPEGTMIKPAKREDDIADAVMEAAETLREGTDTTNDLHSIAMCRALYDLNKMEGGFCCQSLLQEYDGEEYGI